MQINKIILVVLAVVLLSACGSRAVKETENKASSSSFTSKNLASDGNSIDTEGRLIDEERRLIDTEGRLIDIEGRLIDEERRLIDIEGRLIDEERRLIDTEGCLIDEERRLIDTEGRLIDIDGDFIDADGNWVDDSGNLINAFGYLVDRYGNLVNKKGKLIDTKGNLISRRDASKIVKFRKSDVSFILYFAYDNFDLDDFAINEIIKHANFMSDNPKIKLHLEGHADERGTRGYNLALGESRALSIKEVLNLYDLGDRIEVISYGEEKPYSLLHNKNGWNKNRRVEFIYE